jgi:aspartyl protease family protein
MLRLFIYFLLLIGISSCKNCSGSGRRASSNNANTTKIEAPIVPSTDTNTQEVSERFAVPLGSKGGVNTIPVEINGVKMDFIFDTGASDITISTVEAAFLIKQGSISREDVIGEQSYQTADGSINVGLKIRLRTVKIGPSELKNVEASIIDNERAPLLLGQSALQRFGSFSIDNANHQVIFNP